MYVPETQVYGESQCFKMFDIDNSMWKTPLGITFHSQLLQVVRPVLILLSELRETATHSHFMNISILVWSEFPFFCYNLVKSDFMI